ncbi:uncharacterized protein isoform X1 [Rhodnius prolixus]|uniref:uncharacterized protein isoform X1 n=1 Tax=Rhodnius prolixus TaxID=13249 RepID=UPI003D189ECC
MQKNIICSSAATVLFLYPVHLYFQNFLKKKKRELERELGIDVLKVNRCLGFGIENKNNHCNHTEFSCNNLTCDIGKLCYVLNFVKRSKECVDVCIYYLTAKVFANVFIEAHRRGVRVRVIADDSNLEMTNSWISVFLREGIPVRQKISHNLMHHKFIVVDETILINGSMNFTLAGAFKNIESVLISSQPILVQQFMNCFQSMWTVLSPNN